MRQLFPTTKGKAGVLNPTKGNFVLTEDDYKSILESLQLLQDRQLEDENDLEDYKQQLIEAITSGIANFTRLTANEASIREAVIDSLTSTNISGESLTVDTLNALISATIERLTVSGLLQASEINTPTATIQNLESETIEADSIEVENLSVTGSYTINNLESTNANIANLTATTIKSDAANVDNLTASSLTGTEAVIGEISTSELTSAESYSEKIYSHYINHNQAYNKQFIDTTSVGPDGDYYIVLPKFRNGTYYLIAENEASGLYLWSMEVTNSVKNVTFSWSVHSGEAYLQDVEVIEDSTDETQFIQIHCNLNTQAINLYHRCDDLNTQTPPSIYNSKQFDGTQEFEITQQKGNYMPNAVFVGDFHADHLIIDDIQFDKVTVLKQIELASGYDAYGEPLGTTVGLPNQYIKNIEVDGHVRTQWTSPAQEVERDNTDLITSDAVSEYDGQVDLGEDPLDPTQHIYDYPITHLGDNTVVHGKATANKIDVTEEVKLPNLYNGPEADFDATDYASDSIVVFTSVNDPSDYVANKIYRLRKTLTDIYLEEIVAASTLTDQKPVIYDAPTNTFKTSNELDITDIKADTIIVDDLTVNGTAHINNTEEETVVGNFVTLRTNNQAGLTPGEYSGLLVNNYKVGEICALVVDSNGTARVGHATGTKTTYTDLYYVNDKYYTDAELTTEVTPAGVMISWDDKEVIDGVEHWTNAVWTVLNFDSTQALLTRKEDIDMNDQGILIYDKTSHRSETIALPSADKQTLEAHVVEEAGETTISYRWKDMQAGVYHFATEAEYEAAANNIPVDSLIIIDELENNVFGEDIDE